MDRNGTIAGVLAGMLWGLAFLVPALLDGWSPVAVTVGRYLVYGVLSAVLLVLGRAAMRSTARRHWRPAVEYAITGNVGYYLLLVVGVQASGGAVTAVVIGSIPVILTIVGNLLDKSEPWRKLALAIVLAIGGLVMVNTVGAVAGETTLTGLLASFGAVALWTWYGISNTRFLTRNPDVLPGEWATIVGVATGVITVIALPFAVLTGQFDKGTDVPALLVASLVLGVIASWSGTWLWNVASARLPASAAGMLINIETVAGYGYVSIAEGRVPPAGQLAGLVLVLAGVILVARRSAGVPTEPGAATMRE